MSSKVQMRPEGEVVDAFGNVAERLGVLLDLEPHADVLLVGDPRHTRVSGLSTDEDSYPDILHAMAAGLVQRGRRYGLVVWAPHQSEQVQNLTEGLEYLRHLVGESGSILLLVGNRLSLRCLRRHPGRLFDRGLRTRGQYRRLLSASAYTSVREYLAVPTFRFPTELISSDGTIDLPANASGWERGLQLAGALPLFHEGYAYLLSTAVVPGPERLVDMLARRLEETEGDRPLLRLERSALRARGALILFLTDETRGRRILCRITTSEEVDRVVGENLRWTRVLHSNPRLNGAIKQVIPAPIASFTVDGGTAYMEELLPGSIAWKLAANPRQERVLFQGAVRFLDVVGAATVQDRRLSDNELVAELPQPQFRWYDHEFAGLASDLRGQLLRRMAGQRRPFCLSHGDFGYGNLLGDPESRRLTGVIDWDQARDDLYGVDLVNFLIQRRRITDQMSLSGAVREVGERLIERGLEAVELKSNPERRFPGDQAQRAELLAWTLWRCVGRDSRYRRDYEQGREELAACMRWAIARLAA